MRRSLPLVAIATMSKKNRGKSLLITNSKLTLSFKLMLLEIEVKCYLFGNR